MTTGEFTSLSISSIHVLRDKRIRKEVKDSDVQELAESISRKGLIHPIVVTRDGELVAGETRLRACQSLGWTAIPSQFSDELSELEKLEIEFEENVKRRDMPWQDQCDALLRLHELKLEENGPAWTHEQTAESIGLSRTAVTQQLAVAKELKDPASKIKEVKEYSVARGIVQRTNERRAADELSSIGVAEPAPRERADSPIITMDFLEWAPRYEGPPFNLISFDPPYGVNADKFNQGAAEAYGGYDDSEEVYWALLECLFRNKSRLMGTSCHLVLWFSMRYYQRTLEALRTADLWVEPVPLIWFKNDNTGTLPDPTRGPRRVYETAFLCSHGDRKILSAVANTFAAPVTRSGDHMSEKNVEMQKHFFRMFVDKDTRMLDPTCGSGSSLRAARALGAGTILGLEKNPEFAESARRAWEASQ